jgi:hypothetical protein
MREERGGWLNAEHTAEVMDLVKLALMEGDARGWASRPHVRSVTCWCGPTLVRGEDEVWLVHHRDH